MLFDYDALELHLHESHVRCEICAKMNRIEWMVDMAALLAHNAKVHSVCPHAQCSESSIAFATRDEYVRHMQEIHGDRTLVGSFTVDPATLEDAEPTPREKAIELNRRFMRRLRTVFDDRPEVIQQLSAHARGLIEGKINCRDFYVVFGQLCGEMKNVIFTDMVAIMPDPRKRAELLRLHENLGLTPVPARVQQQPRKGKKIRLIPFVLN